METPSASRTCRPDSSILWDVIEEHFDEAEVLFEQWQRALYSPKYSLKQLEITWERRLAAHLDALLVGGDEVAARILYPALQNEDEPIRATVAALGLLFAHDDEPSNHVIKAVQDAKGPLRKAIALALVLCSVKRLDGMVLEALQTSRNDLEIAVLLEIMTGRGVDVGEQLRGYLEAEDPHLRCAALGALGRFPRREMTSFAEQHLVAGDACVQRNALKASLVLGSWAGWNLCLQLIRAGSTNDTELLLLFLILGKPEDQQILWQQLNSPAQRELILWMLGFCGTVEAADACVKHLKGENGRTAKIAAESLAWMSGFNLSEDRFRLPSPVSAEDETPTSFDDERLEASSVLNGADDLPIPNQPAIAAWWKENCSRFTPRQRYLRGQPYSPAAMMHALQTGPLWRRHGVALELFIRSGGKQHVSTEAFSSRQYAQMNAPTGTLSFYRDTQP